MYDNLQRFSAELNTCSIIRISCWGFDMQMKKHEEKIYCIFYIFKNIHTVASWNGVSSSPFFKINSMIILYMDFLSLHIINLDNWDTISQCLQYRTSWAEAAGAQEQQVRCHPLLQTTLGLQVGRAKPVLGFCCRSWDTAMGWDSACFPPRTILLHKQE